MATNSELFLADLQAKFGTQDLSRYNIRRQSYWDYVRYPVAGTNSLRFFVNPIGSTDPVSGLAKTLEQTNIQRPNELTQSFYLTQIKTHVHLLPKLRQNSTLAALPRWIGGQCVTTQDTLAQLSQQGVLFVKFGEKQYFDLAQPFLTAPYGTGVDITNLGAAAAASAIPQNRWFQQSNDPADIFNVTPPILIEKSQTLDIQIQFPNGTSPAISQISSTNVAIDIGLIFEGLIIEPLQ